MRSIFLPAISLLNRLKFTQKIIYACIAFLVPVFIFMSISAGEVYSEYKNAKKLDQALVYSNALKSFYMNVPQHRGMMNAKLNGDNSFDKQIADIREKISDNIIVIDSLSSTLHNKFDTGNKWEEIKQSWQEKLSLMGNLSAKECFDFHTKLIHDTAGIMTIIGEHFRSSMSTVDLIDFYMMKVLTEDIVAITEYAGQVRGIGAGIVAKRGISDLERQKLLSLGSVIEVWQDILDNHLHAIITHINKLTAQGHGHGSSEQHLILTAKFKNAIQASNAFSELLDKFITSSSEISVDSVFFFEDATAIINSQFELYDTISAELAEHIESHYDGFVQKTVTGILLLLLILLLVAYLNSAFYISFMDSLERIIGGAQKIGKGNYGYMIDLDTKDEMLLLCNAFNAMSGDLLKHHAFLNSYKNAIDESAIITSTDTAGNIIDGNGKFYEITGYSRNEIFGQSQYLLSSPDTSKALRDEQWESINEKKVWHGIMKNVKKNGREFYTDTTIVPILDGNGHIAEFITFRKDITELIRNREMLLKQLYTDSLTGLDNRRKLITDLQDKPDSLLILLNVDRYREINDYYGHTTGDEILIAIKDRLLMHTGAFEPSLYRLHADEFALLLPEEKLTQTLKETVRDLHAGLTKEVYSVLSGDFDLNITLSAAANTGESITGISNVLINADLALRSARKEKKEYLVYDETILLKAEFENNLKWTKELKEAIKEDRIVPYYQPIINNTTGEIEKYECLMRLIEKDGTVISPFIFMQTAKKAKLYTKLTQIMVRKSFETFKESPYEFSINLSADDILDRKTSDFIKKSISDSPAADRVVLEIVESEGIENFEEISSFIQFAKSAGCKIAIDDFGTGYSNFEYLLKLNIDIIKMDGSLIKNIHKDKDAQRVVETIIDFANKLGLQTVAEFVHSKEVLDKTREMNIGYSQGYYFSEPTKNIA